MNRTRRERRIRSGDRARATVLAIALGVLGVVIVLAVAIMLVRAGDGAADEVAAEPARLSLEAIESTGQATTERSVTPSSARLEVPDVTGKSIEEAEALLVAVGLKVQRRETAQVLPAGSAITVVSQDPEAGSVVEAGSAVLLRVPGVEGAMATVASGAVVCIDPGHQGSSDLKTEPIGPGATETKERVLGGTTGVATRLPEYEVVMQISMNLKARLEASGVTVVMTRMDNDARISNAERAEVANKAGADLFIRVHADGSTNPEASGISTLYPGTNQWTGPIVGPSKVAAETIQAATVAATGAVSRGSVPRTDITGFNWSKVPAVVVECGFMTNPVEDRLLASPHYQDKLAEGMKNGILAYLESRQP